MNATIHAAKTAQTTTLAARVNKPSALSLEALDGQTVLGESGALRIVFTRKSLTPEKDAAFQVHWLLPLSDPDLALESRQLSGEILWLCSTPPWSVVGNLASEVQGAWWDGPVITFKWKDGMESYAVPHLSHLEGSLLVLAEVVSRRWIGQSPAEVRLALLEGHQRFSKPDQHEIIEIALHA